MLSPLRQRGDRGTSRSACELEQQLTTASTALAKQYEAEMEHQAEGVDELCRSRCNGSKKPSRT